MDKIRKIKEMIAAIDYARNNELNCPKCNSPCDDLATCDDDGNPVFDHRCDCSMELSIELYELEKPSDLQVDSEIQDYIESLDPTVIMPKTDLFRKPIKIYIKSCHYCHAADGVDSSLPECTEDPPYKYRCKYCKQSLRSDKYFGEGKIFDCAMLKKTWYFAPNNRPTRYKSG